MRTAPGLLLLLVTLSGAACGRSTSTDASANDSPVKATQAASGPTRPRPPARLAPFKKVQEEIDRLCPLLDGGLGPTATLRVERRDAGRPDAGGKEASCLERFVQAEIDQALAPLRGSDVKRFAALGREQMRFRKWLDELCAFEELSVGVDLDKRTRTEAPSSEARAVCAARALQERAYYARAVGADDASALADRTDVARADGQRVVDRLQRLGSLAMQGERGAPTSSVDASLLPRALTKEEQAALATRSRAVLAGAHALAQSTCTWATLAELAGGPFGCEDTLTRYYLAPGVAR